MQRGNACVDLSYVWRSTGCDKPDDALEMGEIALPETVVASPLVCHRSVGTTRSSKERSEASSSNVRLTEALGFMLRLIYDRQ